MYMLVSLISLAFDIYLFIIIAQIAVSWLIAFDVMNTDNPQARNLVELLRKGTDPIYKPLRKYIPAIGGIDISPIIVILGLQLLESTIINLLTGPIG